MATFCIFPKRSYLSICKGFFSFPLATVRKFAHKNGTGARLMQVMGFLKKV
jgi:hypothetical protein